MVKLYVGKIFTLRSMSTRSDVKHIWLDEKCTKPRYGNKMNSTIYSLEELGNVLVIKERSKRVKILGKNKATGWISKYYLSKEVVTEDTQNKLELCEQAIKDVQKLLDSEQDNPVTQNLLTTLGKLNNLLRK